ncbi:MAG: hypothetical protein ACXACY_22905 [Candidatus Hodarchaeales archaeon]|jgi:hypothetical protein
MMFERGISESRGSRRVIKEYYVYRKGDPKKGVIVKSLEKLTAVEAKDKACNNGLFPKEFRKDLRVRKKGR